jgi:hypothetical protein
MFVVLSAGSKNTRNAKLDELLGNSKRCVSMCIASLLAEIFETAKANIPAKAAQRHSCWPRRRRGQENDRICANLLNLVIASDRSAPAIS